MGSKHWSENSVCANRLAAAAGHEWNAALVEQEHHRGMIGEQYFADSFWENELARYQKHMGQLQS
jgi:hypothetical protein